MGLMAALWGAIEIAVGGVIKGWHVPFGGSLLSAFGVVILLTARASVPRRWSSLMIGAVAAGLRFASGFGGAVFAAVGILVEAAIVELVLTVWPRPEQRSRMVAGVLAVLWVLVHPFVVQGYVAGLGPARVYGFTVGLIVGKDPLSSVQLAIVLLSLVIVHIVLGVCAVLFVDRILLAPHLRARRAGEKLTRSTTREGGTRLLVLMLVPLVLLGVLGQGAAAQTPGVETPDAETMASWVEEGETVWLFPEFTVTGSRLFGPYSVTEMDSKDIEELGAGDLSEALESIPGVAVRTNSRGEAILYSRGLSERELVLLVDGVPVADPYTGAVNPALIPAGAVESVRVIKGPVASVYGANALGGVVEVTTAGKGRPGMSYMASTGTDGRYLGHVSAGARLGWVRLSGGIAARGTDDFALPDSYEEEEWEDGDERDFSSRDDVTAWGRASWRAGSDIEAALSFQVSDSSWEAPVSTSSDRPRFWTFPYWRETRTVGSVAWRPSDAVTVEGRFFHGTNDNELASYSDFERTERQWLSTVANEAYGGYVYTEVEAGEAQLISGGLNVRRDEASMQDDVGEDWDEYDSTTMSFFAQDVVRLGSDDRVALAMNVDAMSGDDASLVSFNPQASWSRRLGSGMSLRLTGGMKTRFPTLKEWFSPSIGNPDLDPEKSVSVEAEVQKRMAAGPTLSLLVFEQRVTDMIVSRGNNDPARNVGKVISWGAEAGVSHTLTRELDVSLRAAATSAKDDETDEYIEYVPRTELSASVRYIRGAGTVLTRVSYVGTRPEWGEDDLEPYTLVDLRGSLSTGWGELFAGVENVFDELYEDSEGYPQAGRALVIGISRDLYR
jgi:outer membrane cobalamin receptor